MIFRKKIKKIVKKIAKIVNFFVNFWPPGEIFTVLLDRLSSWRLVLLDPNVLLDRRPLRQTPVYMLFVLFDCYRWANEMSKMAVFDWLFGFLTTFPNIFGRGKKNPTLEFSALSIG